MMPKFKVGDKVRIVKYGALLWSNKKIKALPFVFNDEDGMGYYDWRSDLVGKEAVVDGVSKTHHNQYTLAGIDKHAWYNEEQLELV